MAVNEKVRSFIKHELDLKKISTESSVRSKVFEQFCIDNKDATDDKLDWKKHRTIFTNELRKELSRRNVDPMTYGLSRPRGTGNQFHSDGGLTPNIQPVPKQRTINQNAPNAPHGSSAPLAPKGATAPPLLDANGQPIPQEPQIPITKDIVTATWSTIASLIKIKYPSFKKISESELSTLGEAWLPIFQEYMQFSYMKWGMPLFVTAGILLPRIADVKIPEETPRKDPREQRKENEKKTKSDDDGMTFAEYKKSLERK